MPPVSKPAAKATLLLTILGIAACAARSPDDGRWIGPVTPTTPGPTCIPTRAQLDIKGQTITFAPNEGTWILQGDISPTGRIEASKSTIGADKRPFKTTLAAQRTAARIEGTYTTPRCTFQVQLTRPAS